MGLSGWSLVKVDELRKLNWTVYKSGRFQKQKVEAMTGRYFEYKLIQNKDVLIPL